MFRNYFKIALRYFRRNKRYTTINVLGLSIGITACLVISLIVSFESSFDKLWEDKDQIFRVYCNYSGAFEGVNRGVPSALGPWLQENVTGVEEVVPFHTWRAPVIVHTGDGDKREMGRQRRLALVGPAYFRVFSKYKWIVGSPDESLSQPNQVVLTPERVEYYFGLEQPELAIGRTLQYKDSVFATVTGIVEQPRARTDFDFKEFLSFRTIAGTPLKREIWPNDWTFTGGDSQLFLRLSNEKTAKELEKDLLEARTVYQIHSKENPNAPDFLLQPLSNLHFNSELGIFSGSRSAAHKPTLLLLSVIAALLLLIAAINFINLETAQSLKRAKEVGVRKAMGGSRKDLILQFLGSTLILTLVSVTIAGALTQWALVYYQDFMPDGLEFDLFDPTTIVLMGTLTVLICLIAGAYPAFVLSAFKPVQALKNQVLGGRTSKGGIFFRRSLVIFQFVIAQVLIFGTLTVSQQIRYLLNKDMGFKKDAIVYFKVPRRDTTARKKVLMQELSRLPEVAGISNHNSFPAQKYYAVGQLQFQKEDEEVTHRVQMKYADTAFVDLFELDIIAGRNVRQAGADTIMEVLINENYAQALGFQKLEEILGQTLDWGSSLVPIVGVVADFHIAPLYEPIQPMVIVGREGSTISLKLRPHPSGEERFSEVLAKVEAQWDALYPEEKFSYNFVDEHIAKFYEREWTTAKLVNTATSLAIFICCLGLFGLISFITAQRTKEMGIRKILGASVTQLLAMLTKNFLWLVAIALVIASPIAFWSSKQWLKEFAYTIEIEWWQFLLVGVVGIGIALLTISFHSYQAATANPVDSLRQE